MELNVADVPGNNRYEARDEEANGRVVAFADYILTSGLITFTHTEVEPEYEGLGVASQLVRDSLDDVRRRGLAVLPVCPFYKGWIQLHPDYVDLLYRKEPSTSAE
ncbi:N-acetyltransferase [Spiractinospora alimapuensis]|uniref:GNAT family N-acetyltransferase n=1 Tax=Spiractinospora alimapuensis TaxID=2820884 RepID=UPI001F4143D0|nr:GNAT family N-acetyltransferase [Spiractinospora alimapuensis]QVQ51603.1 N-acetyltransferase [Spiractinospora alimapuensis]